MAEDAGVAGGAGGVLAELAQEPRQARIEITYADGSRGVLTGDALASWLKGSFALTEFWLSRCWGGEPNLARAWALAEKIAPDPALRAT